MSNPEPVRTSEASPAPRPAPSSVPLSAPLYGTTPGPAWSRFWRKYATFDGRASRSEFWWACLVLAVIHAFVVAIAYVIAGIDAQPAGIMGATAIYGVLGLWGLVILIPSLAVAARRLHDANLSGAWLFVLLVPVVGLIILIFLLARESRPEGAHFDRGTA
ncbi:DUF805 domain-containing protein [Microbacterium sp. SLBN-146]|uniref:DUF805 domain-containing protein n=1 Tax=Microbacterium sp. SLBN-146 TaxID=2768457 RepID=UPI0011545D42|nr:DUF805 domain-containing protein [Microbacterium sp. SLBN-146]TQJ30308.1 uncharacterized membrane protein YhaH (DUF805 family) [Microbacterium sp. SLBN-146]